MNADTKRQVQCLVATNLALSESIRELGEIPAGHLYARCLDYLDLDTFERLIGIIVDSGVVERRGHLLVWKGGPS